VFKRISGIIFPNVVSASPKNNDVFLR
jgi:hypothetical protein